MDALLRFKTRLLSGFESCVSLLETLVELKTLFQIEDTIVQFERLFSIKDASTFKVSRQKGFYFPLETDRAFLTSNFYSFTREYELREQILSTRFPSNQDLLDLQKGYWENFFLYPYLYRAFFSFLFVTHVAYHATNGLISTISLSHAILFPFLSNLPFNLTTLIWQFAQFARKGLINSLCRPQYFIRSVWKNLTINT